jgi:4-diphosphocytidyl-2-C-methyl-D-erythritol kinase
VKIRAPGKINLRLRVVGKRNDGYHLIDTIMAPVSLYDEIEISKGRRLRGTKPGPRRLIVTCDDPKVPAGKKNIVYQAAELMLRSGRIDQPVKIHIRKEIPLGSGLGGGSTDAAATLMGLNHLFHIGYSAKKLKALALSLGADVPFFIDRRPARARGIGERLSSIPELPRVWVVIAYPGFSVSTAWAYGRLPIKLTRPVANTKFMRLIRRPINLRRLLVNDLETVTVARYPRIGRLKTRLIAEGAEGALMSGSGSAVFGLFNSKGRAMLALVQLRKEEGVQAFLVRILN